jgi:hypothetical protein
VQKGKASNDKQRAQKHRSKKTAPSPASRRIFSRSSRRESGGGVPAGSGVGLGAGSGLAGRGGLESRHDCAP